MEITRKHTILIAVLSGVLLILTVAAALIFTAGDGAAVPEPTASPALTPSPTDTPAPADTPAPTVFRLPLVPQWDTPLPTSEPKGTGVFAPRTAAPPESAGPLAGAPDQRTRDVLAVGLRDGRAAAFLLLRLSDDDLTVLALPGTAEPLGPGGPEAQGARAAALAEQKTGVGCGAWMALDLGCLPAVLAVTGPLGDRGGEVASAEDALALLTEAVRYVRRASLLKLPALKRAVGESFGSNLTARELWSLFRAVRGGVTVRSRLLSSEETAAGSQKYFGESS